MSDEAEIQQWIEYAEHPTVFRRPVLNNSLLVGTINNILRHNNQPLIELHEIYDPSAEEIETSTEHFKSVLKKIKIPKITQIKNPREKVDKARSEIYDITSTGKFNKQFAESIRELMKFTKNSFTGINIEYSQEATIPITHSLECQFMYRTESVIHTLKNENFSTLILNFFISDVIQNEIRKMLDTYEFFEFGYSDKYIRFAHTIFVYVDNKDKRIIGDFYITPQIFDLQQQFSDFIEEGSLIYAFEKNKPSDIPYFKALFELMIIIPIGNFGYTLEGLPDIQKGPVCKFWIFFRMVFYNLTRQQLLEKLAIAVETIGFEPTIENIESIIVVMVREMLNNPEIKQRHRIADSMTGFGLNKK